MKLLPIWVKLSKTGASKVADPREGRYVTLSNKLALFSIGIVLVILLALFLGIPGRGWTPTRQLLISSVGVFTAILMFNHIGKLQLSKWLICWFPPAFCILVSIFDKIVQTGKVTIEDFFSYRYIILITAIFPLLIFNTRQRSLILANLVPSFIALMLFDPIHNVLSIGFENFGFFEERYYMINVFIGIAYFGLIGFMLNLKITTDTFENNLHERNNELFNKNRQIKVQNDEILAQSKALKLSNQELIHAKQKIELQNNILEEKVSEKTRHLSKANEQLVLQNNELRQFSFMLSHHLKSPVASFKGLLNLVQKNGMKKENEAIVEHFASTLMKMEEVFRDLNEMLELRHDLYQQHTKVNIRTEIDDVCGYYINEILKLNILIVNKVQDYYLITNLQKLRSILFNLVSNAIKYRSAERRPEICFASFIEDDLFVLKVRDNGIGIDLDLYRDKLFQIFQRFHDHTDGKGMGLYLVKTQAESLGGFVNVSSQVDDFTEFEIGFRSMPLDS